MSPLETHPRSVRCGHFRRPAVPPTLSISTQASSCRLRSPGSDRRRVGRGGARRMGERPGGVGALPVAPNGSPFNG